MSAAPRAGFMGMQSAQESLGLGLMLCYCQFKILNIILELVFFKWNQQNNGARAWAEKIHTLCMIAMIPLAHSRVFMMTPEHSKGTHSIGIHWDLKQAQASELGLWLSKSRWGGQSGSHERPCFPFEWELASNVDRKQWSSKKPEQLRNSIISFLIHVYFPVLADRMC